MIAGAGVMPVPNAHLLLAMGRAHARIHVEHDASRRAVTVHKGDPLAGQIGNSREVLGCREPLRLRRGNCSPPVSFAGTNLRRSRQRLLPAKYAVQEGSGFSFGARCRLQSRARVSVACRRGAKRAEQRTLDILALVCRETAK